MKYVIDTHLHIYPFYSIRDSIDALLQNLSAASPGATAIGCLTERFDCNIFQELGDSAPAEVAEHYQLDTTPAYHKFTNKNSGMTGYLLPGQQIITQENLEILSLNCTTRIEEGLSSKETIDQVIQCNGIPVVAFGFGKWLGGRGKLVSALVDQYQSNQLALGDTTMRPYGWCTTAQFRQAKSKGLKVLCGSDPLPFKGEEIRPGSYATEVEMDSLDPSSVVSQILRESVQTQIVGKRNTPFQVARRMQNHRNAGTIGAC